MLPDNIQKHKEKLRLAIEARAQGNTHAAKQQLAMILDEVDEAWEIEDVLHRAKLLAKEINKEENLVKSRWIILIVLMANAIVLGVLLLVPVKSVYIDAEITTSLVQIENKERITLGEIEATSVDLSAFGKLKINDPTASRLAADFWQGKKTKIDTKDHHSRPTPPALLSFNAASRFSSATIEGGQVSIQYVNIFPNSTLTISQSTDSDELTLLELVKGRMDGEIIPSNLGRLSLEKINVNQKKNWSGEINISKSSPIVFDSDGMNMHMGIISYVDKGHNPTLLNYKISSINFIEEEDKHSISRITSANIQFPDYDTDNLQFRKGDILTIEMSNPIDIKELTFTNPLKISLEGKVTTLTRNDRSLKPSLLEWFVKHHLNALYFFAFASVASFAWANLKRLELLRASRD